MELYFACAEKRPVEFYTYQIYLLRFRVKSHFQIKTKCSSRRPSLKETLKNVL